MSEEPPGNWELQRTLNRVSADLKDGLAQINARFDSMVSTGVYQAEQRRVDDRLKELADDIAQEREARKADLAALTAQMERTAMWLRWIATGLIIPVVLAIANIVLAQGAGP